LREKWRLRHPPSLSTPLAVWPVLPMI
jgi:hypothetical protein